MNVFLMFLLRLRSLNNLEQVSRDEQAWRVWAGGEPPSPEAIGYSFTRFDCDRLRQGLRRVAKKLGRNKALSLGKVKGMTVVALDGHETFSSYHRCCPECSAREIKTTEGEKTQYYHRVEMALVVGPPAGRPILDLEPIRKDEGELTAGMRLLERLLGNYPRYFDVVTLDGLYASGSLVKLLRAHGKHVVIVLKNEERDLFEDAKSLFARTPPRHVTRGNTQYQLWDLEEFSTWPQTGTTVRVVRSLEEKIVTERIAGKKVQRIETHDWWWVTTLPKEVTTMEVVEIGHWRWEIENQGFNELVNHWYMDHCYKHDPVAIEAFLLTLAIAYTLFHAFVSRNLKTSPRRKRSLSHIAELLSQSLSKELPRSRSP
jgi:hypothetical protein